MCATCDCERQRNGEACSDEPGDEVDEVDEIVSADRNGSNKHHLIEGDARPAPTGNPRKRPFQDNYARSMETRERHDAAEILGARSPSR